MKEEIQERTLPQNVEAEMGVLGSILIDGEVYDAVADQLKSDDFYRNAHRIIYQAIVSLAVQQVKADSITVSDELDRMGKLEEIGGFSYLSRLSNSTPTSGHAGYYAQIVARTAVNRRLAHVAGMIAQLAYDQDPQSIEKSEQLLFELESAGLSQAFSGMPEMVGEYMAELDYLSENKGTYSGVPTGYKDIDDTLGGLQKTDLILLGGRPGSGKTSLGLCIGYNAALMGYNVAVFSLEMGKRQLMRRMMAMASKVDLQRLRSGWIADGEWDVIVEKAGNLSKLPVWVNDTASNPIASMRSQLRRLIQQQERVDLVIVDYLGLIGPDEGKESENRVQEISKISAGLKKLAREFDLPVLALSQLSREVEKRQNKRPQLSDLRESGSLEQDSDVVLFLYREDYYAEQEKRDGYVPTNEAEVNIAKHRNGPVGGVNLYFKGEQTMFYNLEEKLEQGRRD